MGATFFEGRAVPPHVRAAMGGYGYGAYGDGGDAAASVVNSLTTGAVGIANAVSPWNFLTGIFVSKPEAEAAANLQAQQIAAQQNEALAAARSTMFRTIAIAGAGLVGLIVVAAVLKPPRPKSSTSGYRRRRRR